jgi:hypothetical protein
MQRLLLKWLTLKNRIGSLKAMENTEYKLVKLTQNCGDSYANFESLVQQNLNMGYILSGSISVSRTFKYDNCKEILVQAVVKNKEPTVP